MDQLKRHSQQSNKSSEDTNANPRESIKFEARESAEEWSSDDEGSPNVSLQRKGRRPSKGGGGHQREKSIAETATEIDEFLDGIKTPRDPVK